MGSDLFTAAKQLAESEIELIKAIENSSKCPRTVRNMPAGVKKTRKPGKSGNVNILLTIYIILFYVVLFHLYAFHAKFRYSNIYELRISVVLILKKFIINSYLVFFIN